MEFEQRRRVTGWSDHTVARINVITRHVPPAHAKNCLRRGTFGADRGEDRVGWQEVVSAVGRLLRRIHESAEIDAGDTHVGLFHELAGLGVLVTGVASGEGQASSESEE